MGTIADTSMGGSTATSPNPQVKQEPFLRISKHLGKNTTRKSNPVWSGWTIWHDIKSKYPIHHHTYACWRDRHLSFFAKPSTFFRPSKRPFRAFSFFFPRSHLESSCGSPVSTWGNFTLQQKKKETTARPVALPQPSIVFWPVFVICAGSIQDAGFCSSML